MKIFKGLDLVDKVSKEVWMGVCNIIQEELTKNIWKKKKCKKPKWLSKEALQIAELNRQTECKGEREIYIQLNAET